MGFTLLEITLIVVLGYGFYCLMRPVQHRLERFLYRLFSRGSSKDPKPVINVNFTKKDQ